MFTGIVEGTAKVVDVRDKREVRLLVVALPEIADEISLGESVAINGVCLTAISIKNGEVSFDVMGETLRRTNLGLLRRGESVNYERALRVSDRLSGHIVTGHIDGLGTLERIEKRQNECHMFIRTSDEIMSEIVERGSVAIDGISLTVAEKLRNGFRVALIPHTLETTNLKLRRRGDNLNIETDIIVKYLQELIRKPKMDKNFLKRYGFL